MPTFIALYQGPTLRDAQILAVSVSPTLVQHVAAELLEDSRYDPNQADPVLATIAESKSRALRMIATEGAAR